MINKDSLSYIARSVHLVAVPAHEAHETYHAIRTVLDEYGIDSSLQHRLLAGYSNVIQYMLTEYGALDPLNPEMTDHPRPTKKPNASLLKNHGRENICLEDNCSKETQMKNSKTPIGNPVPVGRMAYQLYSRVWQGRVKHSARVGRPYVNKETGQPGLVPELDDYTADDFIKAAHAAKKQLTQLTQSAYQQIARQGQARGSGPQSTQPPAAHGHSSKTPQHAFLQQPYTQVPQYQGPPPGSGPYPPEDT